MRSAGEPIYSPDSLRPTPPQAHREMLSAAEERQLADRWKTCGDLTARKGLISAFQPLVRHEARSYRYAHYGIPLTDRVQCANIGLMKAIDRFDPDKARLSTYARLWIRAEIMDLVRHSFGPVTIPKGQPILPGVSLNQRIETEDGESEERQNILENDPADQEAVLTEAAEIGHLRDRLDAITDSVLNDRERAIFEARCLSDDPPILDDLCQAIRREPGADSADRGRRERQSRTRSQATSEAQQATHGSTSRDGRVLRGNPATTSRP
jgi:RNA polymerase sigma factor (sigma-70 family)